MSKRKPDYRIPPAATLQETMDKLGMDRAALAKAAGLETRIIDALLDRPPTATVTMSMAVALERATRVAASLWRNLDRQYREAL